VLAARLGLVTGLIKVNRDIRGCAFLLYDNVVLGLIDDRFDFWQRVTLGDDEPDRFCADVLVLGACQDNSFGARRIRALTEEVVRCLRLAEGIGDLTDAFVHISEQRLVRRKSFFLGFLHRRSVAPRAWVGASPRGGASNRVDAYT
jgi:hypothetical protein